MDWRRASKASPMCITETMNTGFLATMACLDGYSRGLREREKRSKFVGVTFWSSETARSFARILIGKLLNRRVNQGHEPEQSDSSIFSSLTLRSASATLSCSRSFIFAAWENGQAAAWLKKSYRHAHKIFSEWYNQLVLKAQLADY